MAENDMERLVDDDCKSEAPSQGEASTVVSSSTHNLDEDNTASEFGNSTLEDEPEDNLDEDNVASEVGSNEVGSSTLQNEPDDNLVEDYAANEDDLMEDIAASHVDAQLDAQFTWTPWLSALCVEDTQTWASPMTMPTTAPQATMAAATAAQVAAPPPPPPPPPPTRAMLAARAAEARMATATAAEAPPPPPPPPGAPPPPPPPPPPTPAMLAAVERRMAAARAAEARMATATAAEAPPPPPGPPPQTSSTSATPTVVARRSQGLRLTSEQYKAIIDAMKLGNVLGMITVDDFIDQFGLVDAEHHPWGDTLWQGMAHHLAICAQRCAYKQAYTIQASLSSGGMWGWFWADGIASPSRDEATSPLGSQGGTDATFQVYPCWCFLCGTWYRMICFHLIIGRMNLWWCHPSRIQSAL